MDRPGTAYLPPFHVKRNRMRPWPAPRREWARALELRWPPASSRHERRECWFPSRNSIQVAVIAGPKGLQALDICIQALDICGPTCRAQRASSASPIPYAALGGRYRSASIGQRVYAPFHVEHPAYDPLSLRSGQPSKAQLPSVPEGPVPVQDVPRRARPLHQSVRAPEAMPRDGY